MRALIMTAGVLALCAGAASAQQPADRALPERIDRIVAPFIALQVFDGSILVARGDRIVAERSYGHASLEHGIPNGPETVYRVASVSKPFTRMLVARLARQGVVGVDEPIARWLPDFPQAERITLRMLLDHRAGVPGMNSLPWDEEAWTAPDLAALVDTIATRPLDFEPGTSRSYSNGGYAVIARVLELATGRPYAAMLLEEVVAPLGLEHTRHEGDGDVVAGRAFGYMPSPTTPMQLVRAPFQSMATKTGGGSLVSTPRDLLRWVRAIGRSALLDDATWRDLFPVPADSVRVYDGRSPGFNSVVLHDAHDDLTVVVLANNYAAGGLHAIAGALHDVLEGREPPPFDVTAPIQADVDVSTLTGTYEGPQDFLPAPLTLREQDGYLVASLSGVPVDVLIPQGGRRFLSRTLWSIVEFGTASETDSPVMTVSALYADRSHELRRIGP